MHGSRLAHKPQSFGRIKGVGPKAGVFEKGG